jgi:hypothetical protein
MSGGPRRFGVGVTSLPLTIRLAITAPFVLLALILGHSLLAWIREDDPRPAALILLLLGATGGVAGLVVPHVRHSSAEWRSGRSRSARLTRELEMVVAQVPVQDPGMWGMHPACPACGQRGTAAALRAGARCPTCGRPLPQPPVPG